MTRFDRQIKLMGFGNEGQQKLNSASVLVIGAGGLGCPALLYLAAAGVGKIGVVDGDVVDISNLNRQVLYGESDVGKSKVGVAVERIRQKYYNIAVEGYEQFIDNSNAIALISKYDVVLDCCDNFSTRYLVNDACVLLNKPLVYGAIYQYEGQVSVFNVQDLNGIAHNYRDLFPDPPDAGQIPNCNDTGVLGVLPGIIGTLQATEAIKLIVGLGNILCGKMLYYNLLDQRFNELAIDKNPVSDQKIPASQIEFQDRDYRITCAAVKNIDWDKALEMFFLNPELTAFVDVREKDELPKIEAVPCLALPLSSIAQQINCLLPYENVLVFCKSGLRSDKAVMQLQQADPFRKYYSILGGIMNNLSPNNNKPYAKEV
ncbi:MAG: dinucleotide-utilizing protein [Bacteroidetes bacterium]|nr:dinucleotide-utilizing protein [Bacteroidota bacterium]